MTKRRLNQALSILSLSLGFWVFVLLFIRAILWVSLVCVLYVISWLLWFVSTNANVWLQRLVPEMTYNDPAHSLTVFSLIPVWFVMAILTVVIHDWILLPCYVFAMFILTIIMLKITQIISTEKRYSLYKTRWLWIENPIFLQND